MSKINKSILFQDVCVVYIIMYKYIKCVFTENYRYVKKQKKLIAVKLKIEAL